jgi:hypothetical protein
MSSRDRGEFGLRAGVPKIHRRVAGRIVVEPLYEVEPEEEVDELLAGVTRDDLNGKTARFMTHFEPQRRQAGAGAGPDVSERYRGQQRNYDVTGLGGEDLFQDPADLIGDDSSMDLLGQPVGDQFGRAVRPELADRPQNPYRSGRPAEYDHDDDVFDMSLLDPYTPTGRPSREPALARRNDSLVNLFRDTGKR